jgi:hypothetical protein
MPTTRGGADVARTALEDAQRRVERLRTVDPYFIDLSLRESAFGSRVGQTLADKLAIRAGGHLS